jgi:predicted Fe-Mo cluster-binding NifX family protein
MRIAISAENQAGLEAPVSPHFGRCPYYTIVDLEGEDVPRVACVTNPHYPQHQPGAIPAFIHEQGVNVMITGGMGYRAMELFEGYGIEAVTGAAGTVGQALQHYLAGQLRGAGPCHESSAGCHEH